MDLHHFQSQEKLRALVDDVDQANVCKSEAEYRSAVSIRVCSTEWRVQVAVDHDSWPCWRTSSKSRRHAERGKQPIRLLRGIHRCTTDRILLSMRDSFPRLAALSLSYDERSVAPLNTEQFRSDCSTWIDPERRNRRIERSSNAQEHRQSAADRCSPNSSLLLDPVKQQDWSLGNRSCPLDRPERVEQRTHATFFPLESSLGSSVCALKDPWWFRAARMSLRLLFLRGELFRFNWWRCCRYVFCCFSALSYHRN